MPIADFRQALRQLLARPGYSAISILVLAMGLGACLFMLSVIDGLILRPLPFPESDRLVAIGHSREGSGGVGQVRSRDMARIAPELRGLEQLGQWQLTTVAVSRGGEHPARRYEGSSLSLEMLSLLGAQPVLGRGFGPADDAPGAALTVLLSHRVWQEDFNAETDVIGRRLQVNGEPATVIGVMPPGFAFPVTGEAWLPRRFDPEDGIEANVFGRLRPGVGLPQFRQELEALSLRFGDALEGARDNRQLRAIPLGEHFVGAGTRQYLWLCVAATVLVLLLACANAANLQLVQMSARRRELAVRGALGASRWRLLRELLCESLLLSLAASLLALLLAQAGVRWLLAMLELGGDSPPYFMQFGIDWRLLAYAGAAAFLTTALAGAMPALGASRVSVQSALRDGDKGSGGGFARFGSALVLFQVVLCVVLLVGAGTMARGAQQVLAFDFGTRADPASILTARVGLFSEPPPSPQQQAAFLERVVERLRAEPAVLSASAATALPGTLGDGHELVAAAGRYSGVDSAIQAQHARVDDHFLSTYDIRLLQGRGFDARDRADGERVVVIDRRLAERLWPAGDALGQTLLVNPQREQADRFTVIGVTEALHLEDADDPILPILLVSLRQVPARFATLALRVQGEAQAFAPTLEAAVRAENPDAPVYWVQTQAEAIHGGRIGPLILTKLFGAMAAMALGLSAIGLYGVLGFIVARREREIGIRRAIGADRTSVVASVAGRLGLQVGAGMALGLMLAAPWSMLLEAPQLQTRGMDPLVFVTVAALVLAMAMLACIAPLRRALSVDPAVALRSE
jgi:putative ABC transport system permease protein